MANGRKAEAVRARFRIAHAFPCPYCEAAQRGFILADEWVPVPGMVQHALRECGACGEPYAVELVLQFTIAARQVEGAGPDRRKVLPTPGVLLDSPAQSEQGGAS